MPYYTYCKRANITPFIDLNGKGGKPPVYKNDFTIGKDGVPICQAGLRMRRDGTEVAKGRTKFKCPMISHKAVVSPVLAIIHALMQNTDVLFIW